MLARLLLFALLTTRQLKCPQCYEYTMHEFSVHQNTLNQIQINSNSFSLQLFNYFTKNVTLIYSLLVKLTLSIAPQHFISDGHLKNATIT